MQFKKLCCLLALALISTVSFAQNVAGYYIDNNNVRYDVSFKESNFSDFSHMKYQDESGAYHSLSPEKTKEYGIGNDFKVVRSLVTYDDNATIVSTSNEPVNKVANLFLNVLVEGDATLYSYNLNGLDIFFYSLKEKQNTINQLIYKRYRTSGVSQIYEINTYRNQLFNNIKCEGMNFTDFRGLKYDKNNLVKVFESYNACTKNTSVSYSNKSGNHSKISLSAIGSLYNTGFNFEHFNKKSETKYDLSYGVGIEAALLSSSNKSAIFVRADYRKINTEVVLPVNYDDHFYNKTLETYTYNSSVLELIAGLRYIFNKHIYTDGAIGLSLPNGYINMVKTYVDAPDAIPTKTTYSTSSGTFFSLGLGYMMNNNFGAELRINTPHSIISGYDNADAKLISYGINLRYVVI